MHEMHFPAAPTDTDSLLHRQYPDCQYMFLLFPARIMPTVCKRNNLSGYTLLKHKLSIDNYKDISGAVFFLYSPIRFPAESFQIKDPIYYRYPV